MEREGDRHSLGNSRIAADMKEIILEKDENVPEIKKTEIKKPEVPAEYTFSSGSTFPEEDLIRLLKANRTARIIGNFINSGEFECDCQIATVISHVCGIPYTDDWADWLFKLLDSDLSIEEKADRLRNWNK